MTYSKIQDGPKDSRLKISAIQFWGRHTESSSDPPIIVLEIAKIWLLRFYHLAFKRSNMEKREMFYTSDWTWGHSQWESREDDPPSKKVNNPRILGVGRGCIGRSILGDQWDILPLIWEISLGYFAKLIWYLPQSGHLKRENTYYNDYDYYYDHCCCYDCSYPLKFQTNLSTKRSRLWYPNAKGGKPHQ